MKRKKRWIVPIVAGCLSMYAVLMFLAVWLMKMKYTENFKDYLSILAGNIQQELGSKELAETENENFTDEMRRSYYQYVANSNVQPGNSRFQQFSVGIYDADKRIAAQTRTCALTSYSAHEKSGWQMVYRSYDLGELQEEELRSLVKYQEKNLAANDSPGDYEIIGSVSEDGKTLDRIYVQKLVWEKTEGTPVYYTNPLTGSAMFYTLADGSNYALMDSEVVWEWKRPGAGTGNMESNTDYLEFSFPYLYSGYGEWQKWRNSSYLHDFPEQLDLADDVKSNFFLDEFAAFGSEDYKFGREERMRVAVYSPDAWEHRMQGTPSPVCFLEVRSVSDPWLAALDYMKYVLAAGFVLMLFCMGIIIYTTDRSNRQRSALEETRRDFTNAMAHELKTPLGIIRGFAENLKEHTMEEKWDYYVEKIIDQTEEMDGLVAKMIEVSRLDSENLVLQRDPVSINELFREQMERFSFAISEKNLNIRYEEEGDFMVLGDREYLKKAVWNLLSNAVVYNIQGGSIRIRSTPDQCRIENTAVPLTGEQLSHAFDLFYSGDKSRSSGEKHMGLGLFLSRRIFELHALSISIENTPDGVSVLLKKK